MAQHFSDTWRENRCLLLAFSGDGAFAIGALN